MADRLVKVGELYLQGKSQTAIAVVVKCDQKTVSNDLARLREEWMSRSLEAFEQKKAQELAKIDNLEVAAWEAWQRSCNDAEFSRKRTELGRQIPDGNNRTNGESNPVIKGKVSAVTRRPKPSDKLIAMKVVEETTLRGQAGDERFLGRIAWCIETRLKIIGALTEKVVIAPSQQIDWDALTKREDEADVIEGKIEEVKQLGHQNGQAKGIENA